MNRIKKWRKKKDGNGKGFQDYGREILDVHFPVYSLSSFLDSSYFIPSFIYKFISRVVTVTTAFSRNFLNSSLKTLN